MIIHQTLVWSKAQRVIHAALALAVTALLLTGGLIRWAPERALDVRPWHFYAAALLLAALLARLGLMIWPRSPCESLAAWLPNRHRLSQAWQVLCSYLTLGRIPLPRWYAHNPLWAMLYLALFVVLTIQILTGWALLQHITLVAGLSVHRLHEVGYLIILIFTLLHFAASLFHDAQSIGGDVSAMINGHRTFLIEPLQKNDGPPVVTLKIKSAGAESREHDGG